MISTIESKTVEIGEKIGLDIKKQESALIAVKNSNEQLASNLKDQQKELEEIQNKLEKIEVSVEENQAKLKSIDSPEEIKGIGPALNKELEDIGISNVGQFLITDAEFIRENTRVSNETAKNLQTLAQLMMIPGIDSNEAEMLIEAGVKSRKQLADQELLPLSKNIGAIAKLYSDQGKILEEEQPTIEKISDWIRKAR